MEKGKKKFGQNGKKEANKINWCEITVDRLEKKSNPVYSRFVRECGGRGSHVLHMQKNFHNRSWTSLGILISYWLGSFSSG